jgi:hypothetical protein
LFDWLLPIDNWEKAAQPTNFVILPVAAAEAKQSSKIRHLDWWHASYEYTPIRR